MARITYSVTAVLLKELSWRLKQKQENISQVRPGSRLPDCSPGVRAYTQTWHCKASLRARPARSLYLGLLSAHARNDTPSWGPAARANHKARQPARLRGQSWVGRGAAAGLAQGPGPPGSPQGAPGELPRPQPRQPRAAFNPGFSVPATPGAGNGKAQPSLPRCWNLWGTRFFPDVSCQFYRATRSGDGGWQKFIRREGARTGRRA